MQNIKAHRLTAARDKNALNYASIMGFPIIGQVKHTFRPNRLTPVGLLVLAAIQPRSVGLLSRFVTVAKRLPAADLSDLSQGFFIWEFPTVYIAQKLRLGKYLGECLMI